MLPRIPDSFPHSCRWPRQQSNNIIPVKQCIRTSHLLSQTLVVEPVHLSDLIQHHTRHKRQQLGIKHPLLQLSTLSSLETNTLKPQTTASAQNNANIQPIIIGLPLHPVVSMNEALTTSHALGISIPLLNERSASKLSKA